MDLREGSELPFDEGGHIVRDREVDGLEQGGVRCLENLCGVLPDAEGDEGVDLLVDQELGSRRSPSLRCYR